MSQSELLTAVVAALESTGAPYMLTGSYASSLQGQPRLTHDIDLVVQLTPAAVDKLVAAFPLPDYYVDPAAAHAAIDQHGQFNLIDVVNGDKVDFWLLTDDAFDVSRFSRRSAEIFEGTRLYVSRPEDTILMKLRWASMSGGSEKQLGDVRGIYELQRGALDLDYLEHWAKRLGIEALWEQTKASDRS